MDRPTAKVGCPTALTVVSLFDGISCGREAIKRLAPDCPIRYFASEVHPRSIQVTQDNHPDVVQMGDVRFLRFEDGVIVNEQTGVEFNVGEVYLFLAGFPCQGFSCMGKQQGIEHLQSSLFTHMVELMQQINPTHILLENVRMKATHLEFINAELSPWKLNCFKLNSNKWCAQNRERLYWTNFTVDAFQYFGVDEFPQTLQELIGDGYNGIWNRPHGFQRHVGGFVAAAQKAPCIVKTSYACSAFVMQNQLKVKFTPEQLEALQTLPTGYTKAGNSLTMRASLIGNAWTVSVIQDILFNIFNNHV